MTEISRRNQEFMNSMMSLHNQPVDSTKLRFISPEVLFFFKIRNGGS
jgi:hypothetical protein